MKKNNLFLTILSYIGLVLWAVAFFFGFNYFEEGSLMVSIPVAVFLLIVMGMMVFAMKKFSRGQQENAMQAKNSHIIASVIYAIVALGSAIFLCHFVKVSADYQEDIQVKATQEIQELANTFSEESVPGSYVSWVLDQVDTYGIQLEAEGKDNGTIKVKKSELEGQLMDDSGFSALQSEVNDFLSSCNYSVSNWVWLTVPNYLTRLEENKKEYESKVKEYSASTSFTAEGGDPFSPNSDYNYSGLAEQLTKISADDLGLWSIVLIVILQLFILLDYFVGKPDTGRDPDRYKGSWGRSYGGNRPANNKRSSAPKQPTVNDTPEDGNEEEE